MTENISNEFSIDDLFNSKFSGEAFYKDSRLFSSERDMLDQKYRQVLDTNVDSISVLPFYLYLEMHLRQINSPSSQKTYDLNPEITNQFSKKLSLFFTNEKEEIILENASPVCYATSDEVSEDFKIELPPLSFSSVDILDYVYAQIHSSMYKKKYKRLSKIYPGILYPHDQNTFWRFVKMGAELKQLHFMECSLKTSESTKFISQKNVEGSNLVKKISFQEKKVFINDAQYFDNILQTVWEFYAGDLQPAQIWLTTRNGKILTSYDIQQYLNIIGFLKEAVRIQDQIDNIKI